MVKKSTRQLYYEDLKRLISKTMTESKYSIEKVKEEVDKYLVSQLHFKKLPKDLTDPKLILYIAGESLLDDLLKRIQVKAKEPQGNKVTKRELQDYISSKIQTWTYHTYVVPAPEQVALKLLSTNKERIDNLYNTL